MRVTPPVIGQQNVSDGVGIKRGQAQGRQGARLQRMTQRKEWLKEAPINTQISAHQDCCIRLWQEEECRVAVLKCAQMLIGKENLINLLPAWPLLCKHTLQVDQIVLRERCR